MDFASLLLLAHSAFHHALRRMGLPHMRPYRVMVVGEPLWMESEFENKWEPGGFYTTRWVMAWSPQRAIDRVIRMVEREARFFTRNPPDLPLRVQMEEWAILDGLLKEGPGAGFSFWCPGAFGPDESEQH